MKVLVYLTQKGKPDKAPADSWNVELVRLPVAGERIIRGAEEPEVYEVGQVDHTPDAPEKARVWVWDVNGRAKPGSSASIPSPVGV